MPLEMHCFLWHCFPDRSERCSVKVGHIWKYREKKSLCYRMDLLQAPTIMFLSMHKINCNRTSVLQMASLLFSSQLLPGHGEIGRDLSLASFSRWGTSAVVGPGRMYPLLLLKYAVRIFSSLAHLPPPPTQPSMCTKEHKHLCTHTSIWSSLLSGAVLGLATMRWFGWSAFVDVWPTKLRSHWW